MFAIAIRRRLALLPLGALALSLLPGCFSSSSRKTSEFDTGDRYVDLAPKPLDLEKEEALLAKEARLRSILQIALTRNPEVAEARMRSRAALDRADASARLPDLVLKYQLWGAPLNQPWKLGQAQMHMIGVSQTFPAWGSLDAQSKAGAEEVRMLVELQHARELDIVVKVEKAYFDYYRADRELAIHREHMGLVHAAVELVRAAYVGGKGSQAEVLRVSLEVTRLHNEIIAMEQERTTSIAMLNTLMVRNVDAALGPPIEIDASNVHPQVTELEKLVKTKRPELAAGGYAIKKSEASVEAAKSAAHYPSVMLGFDYMYMPMESMPHNYGVMIGVSLPWLNPKHGEEVRAAEKNLAADKSALESLINTAVFQVRDAAARLSAAQKSYELVDKELLPAAQKSFEATRVTYAGGQGDALALLDALRTYLEVRIDRVRALSRLGSSLADLERAVGVELVRARAVADGKDAKGGAP